MNVLLTGGSGYLGRSIQKHFKDLVNLTTLTRNELDLTKFEDVRSYFQHKYFDVVIHTAISGVSRIKLNEVRDLDTNLQMYYHLMEHREHFGKFINIGSGAELYLQNTMYGLSKHVIRTSLLDKSNVYNMRVFSVFDENELDTRFIKSNIIRYIRKKPIYIFNDKRMDFFYMKDFIKLLEYYLKTEIELPKEIDCVYKESKLLTEVATIINRLASYEVEVSILSSLQEPDYIGNYSNMDICFEGLDKGIQAVYNKLLLNF